MQDFTPSPSGSSSSSVPTPLILFIALIALTLFTARDFYIQIQTFRQVGAAKTQVLQQQGRVQQIAETLRGVSADLIDLAKTSPAAQKIVSDFGIKRQESADSANK